MNILRKYKISRKWILFICVCLLGGALRVCLSTLGHNYDIVSLQIVADIRINGQSVYAETSRYNYGPVIFYIAEWTRRLQLMIPSFQHPEAFHIIFACFLSAIDILIATMLLLSVSIHAAIFFILNPVLMLITGYHSQFDHVAIGIAYASWLLISAPRITLLKSSVSALLLGASLVTKHVFIFFPFWMLFYEPLGSVRRRLFYAAIAWSVFFGSFLFWWEDPLARAGIIKNVFQYATHEGNSLQAHLLPLLFPEDVYLVLEPIPFSAAKLVFIIGMCWSGYRIMRLTPHQGFYLYLVSLLVFTFAVADQYLAIPVMACAYFRRSKFLWIYVILSACFLLGSATNLNIFPYFFHKGIDGERWRYMHCQVWLAFFFILYFARINRLSEKPCGQVPARKTL